MAANATIQGECDQRFERVKRVFAENFERRDELGATVAVTLDGRPVVDLWGGHLDHTKTKPWQRDNIVNVWSTTKGLTAICAHKLAGEGKLDLDAPVTKYWPEFAQGGKAEVPVSYLLNHKAGLAAIRAPLRNEDLFSWEVVTRELARQEPWWTRVANMATTPSPSDGSSAKSCAGSAGKASAPIFVMRSPSRWA